MAVTYAEFNKIMPRKRREGKFDGAKRIASPKIRSKRKGDKN
jgi:hypothetical protein